MGFRDGRHYDAIIVGAGPAGIFAALELTRRSGMRVLILEKGADISERRCPARITGRCAHCATCDITTGWGGAGAFSDGKLTLGSEVGGWLGEYVAADALEQLIRDVDGTYRHYGAPERLYGLDIKKLALWDERARRHSLRLVHSPVRHLGTERAGRVLGAMRAELEGRAHVVTESEVAHILVENGVSNAARRVTGVSTAAGETFSSPAVIVAPGRDGSDWLSLEARSLGIPLVNNPVDIGVRVEVSATLTDAITTDLYEPKLLYTSHHFEDQVRTFCVNPRGVVCTESWGDAVTVNGHSYADAGRKTENTNFALLVSTRFTEPFKEPNDYGKSIARLANMLGGDVLVQRLGDLRAGRRSTPDRIKRGAVEPSLCAATPGDVSFVLPYRHLRDLMDMLEAVDALLPGVGGTDTLLYAAEVKFYSSRLSLDSRLATPNKGLYAVGDGAGVTRGLVQASASGLVAARAVVAEAARGSAALV